MPSRAASASIWAGLRVMVRVVSVMVRCEVLGHLVLVDDLADPEPDLVRAGQSAGGDRGGDRGAGGLGGGQQLGAFAGALGGQGRVAAGDQPFAGVVGVGDLGEVLLVEQGQLQRPVLGGQAS